MLPDLADVTVLETASLVRSRQASATEVTRQALARIQRTDPQLNAFLTVDPGAALEAAEAADRTVAGGVALGPLHGVPVGIKDLSNTRGMRTTFGFALNRERVPAYDDIVVERIRAAGAVIIGKTNTPEFGWKGTTENGLTGPCRNPWNVRCTSGGSSGGSASAVAARLVPAATGSDAGGSIRIPASFCGVFGFKPTFGRVPAAYDGTGGWRVLSQGGPISRTVADAALLFSVMAGPDARDATCLRGPPPDVAQAMRQPSVRGLRVAWSPRLGDAPVDPEVLRVTAAAAQRFAGLGATVEEAGPPVDLQRLIEVFSTLMLTDLRISLEPLFQSGDARHLPTVLREWLEEAGRWPAARYAMALRDREWHRWRFADFFGAYDMLLTPAMAVPAFPIERFPDRIGGAPVDPRWGFTPFCIHANLTGQPAASLPCGATPDGLPVGLQVMGRWGDDAGVLRACAAFEAAYPWAHRRPGVCA